MKISWNYLQSLFEDKLDKPVVLERLTMAGLEVEDESLVAPTFSGIVVGEVVECEKHPDADKLSLCKIDAGTGELLQIICGAPNVAKGVKAPCAKVGAVLPGDFKIAERKMRGLVSYGMMCGGSEIGLDDGVDGLLLLDANAPVGVDIREYLDLNDSIIEFKITPNRGDCLSYAGLAREIVALTGAKLKATKADENYLTNPSTSIALNVAATNDCEHYIGLEIVGVNNKVKIPLWLTKLLERSGIRTISPIVDITNFVMMRLGQPMHAFDLAKIHHGIGVRRAKDGEKLKLLDGKDAELKSNSLIITDGENNPVALAGVMGGLDSGVVETTQDILLESAFFTPHIVSGKTKQYGVNSDSAFRFERGVDPELQHDALNLATRLVLEICGGSVKSYIHYSGKADTSKLIQISINEINNLIGENLGETIILEILNNLGLKVSRENNLLSIEVPSYRFDLAIKQDIVEEIIRVYGYDKIKAQMPKLEYSLDYLDGRVTKNQLLKRRMVAGGFSEVINYAFTEDKYHNYFSDYCPQAIKLQNPIAGLATMRTTLLSGLVKSMQANINRGHQSVKLFEFGRVFHGEEITDQPLYFAALIYGIISPLNWLDKSRLVDFYDLKIQLMNLLAGFGDVEVVASNLPNLYHPGRSAKVIVNKQHIGFIGQLHPHFNQEFSFGELPYVFEIDIDLLMKCTKNFTLKQVSKYQKVSRDLALVVNKTTEAGEMLQIIKQLNLDILADLTVFDVFQGGSLASNKKSVAINMVFHADYNLTEDVINDNLDKIKVELKNKLAAELR